MYMRNNRSKYDKYSKYNISDFPPNYSGQYTKDSIRRDTAEIIEINSDNYEHTEKSGRESEQKIFEKKDVSEQKPVPTPAHHEHHNEKDREEERKDEKRGNQHSLIGGLLGGGKTGGTGILSKFFGEKEGGILGSIELEDIILLAVIFFLLKDGVEDDFLIILALILLA